MGQLDQPLILYLHGFTSGPQSHKAQALGQRMAARGYGQRFICPQLPASPAAAIELTEDLIASKVGAGDTAAQPLTVVGSSLGGFYATWLAEHHDCRAVLVNPAVASAVSLEKYIGPQRWLYSGEAFEFTRQHIAELAALELPALSKPQRFWLLVETGDETLDYRHAVNRYTGARQTVLPDGDHSFTRWTEYLDEIIDFAGFK
jgi:predicted esterase YcpF (UPF0227 family)